MRKDKAARRRLRGSVLKEVLYWAIFIAVILHLVALVFLGQSFMPEKPF